MFSGSKYAEKTGRRGGALYALMLTSRKGGDMIVKPYWKFCQRFCNGRKEYSSDIYLFPTLAIRPFEKTIMNHKRYDIGSWQIVSQVIIMFLFWEWAFTFTKLNYKTDTN